MKRPRYLICAAMCAAIIMPALYAAQDASHTPAPSASGKHAHAPQPAALPNEGEQIFQRNCARCHAAPESFSPSISGTIVRHMRIRANLSAHDERELLRFLNP